MTSYEASRLRRGDQVRFVDREIGVVQSILDGWVKIWWAEDLIAELHIDDFEEVERIGRDVIPDQIAAKAA